MYNVSALSIARRTRDVEIVIITKFESHYTGFGTVMTPYVRNAHDRLDDSTSFHRQMAEDYFTQFCASLLLRSHGLLPVTCKAWSMVRRIYVYGV